MGLQDWAFRVAYGRGYERALDGVFGWDSDAWKRVFLAGHIEGYSAARGRVPRILRSPLRGALRAALRGI